MTKARDNANGGLGLILIKPSSVVNGTDNGKGTVSFSGQTSVSLNDVFSSTYNNYRIVCQYETSGANGFWARLRVSGSDNSSNNYKHVGYYNGMTGTTFGGFNSNALIGYMIFGQSDAASVRSTSSIDILCPYLTEETVYQGHFIANNTSSSGQGFNIWGSTSVTTSYTGLTVYSSNSSTMTGTISIYGYNN